MMEIVMSNNIKSNLLSKITNTDLKLAIAEAPDTVKDTESGNYIPNKLFPELLKSIGRVELKLEELNEKGLFYKNKDVYVYLGRGGVKVEETPKGIRKMLIYLSEKYDRRVVISDGVLYQGDDVVITTDGLIDKVEIQRDTKTMITGGAILAPFAVISILSKRDVVIAKKFIVMPANEFTNALKQAGNVKFTYPSMMATKMVMKRALTQVYSLLGTGIENDDAEMLDDAIENNNIDQVARNSEAISKEQADELWLYIQDNELESNLDRILKGDNLDKMEDIPASKYTQVMNLLKQAAKAKSQQNK